MDELSDTLYADIRKAAAQRLRHDPASRTIGATDLAHDVLLRVMKSKSSVPENRADLMGRIARTIRRALVDRARRRSRMRHGGDRAGRPAVHVDIEAALEVVSLQSSPVDILAIDLALTRLAELDERQAAIIERRFFAGCSIAETAEHLGVSRSTIDKEERKARAWLTFTLSEPSA